MTEQLEGVTVKIGRRDFIVPSFSLNAARKVERLLQAQFEPGAPETVEAVGARAVEIVRIALAQNYPEVTDEEIGDLLNMDNVADVLIDVAAAGGLLKKTAIQPPTEPQANP